MRLDLKDIAFDRGGALLLRRALRSTANGNTILVTGNAPDLFIHLRAWCRTEGHQFHIPDASHNSAAVSKGPAAAERWSASERAGGALPDAAVDCPPQRWGLAARGALVEAGSPDFYFPLSEKVEVWSPDAARIYAQAAAAQWNPATAIPWDASVDLPSEVEDAVVQVMTYLIENETAALIVPSRFIAQMHPHFRETMQVLAIQAADEARHVEVFTRRALLKRSHLGLSTAGGQASLQTLLDEPDFAIASFLLSVLGEGTFLSLLWFIERFAPDALTAAVCRLAAQDEARHVAFGMSHLRHHIGEEPSFREELANAVRRRHDVLMNTTGLNTEVYDALALMAAGSWEPADVAQACDAVALLLRDMHAGRRKRLLQLGFNEAEAEELSALHTRNFM